MGVSGCGSLLQTPKRVLQVDSQDLQEGLGLQPRKDLATLEGGRVADPVPQTVWTGLEATLFPRRQGDARGPPLAGLLMGNPLASQKWVGVRRSG